MSSKKREAESAEKGSGEDDKTKKSRVWDFLEKRWTCHAVVIAPWTYNVEDTHKQ
jgi:hypothetical protein